MNFKLFYQKWLQILSGVILLSAIIIVTSHLMGFKIISTRSLLILFVILVLFSVTFAFSQLSRFNFFTRGWVQLLIAGIAVSVLTMEVIRQTDNTLLLPSAILLNAFVVPAASVAYLYQHVRNRDISIPLLLACFFIGGPIGFFISGFIEHGAPKLGSISGWFGIAVVEECAKLIFPVTMFMIWKYKHEVDGLLFGVASGMGFAAVETMGYAQSAFTQSNETLWSIQWVLLYRGLLTPAMHVLPLSELFLSP